MHRDLYHFSRHPNFNKKIYFEIKIFSNCFFWFGKRLRTISEQSRDEPVVMTISEHRYREHFSTVLPFLNLTFRTLKFSILKPHTVFSHSVVFRLFREIKKNTSRSILYGPYHMVHIIWTISRPCTGLQYALK